MTRNAAPATALSVDSVIAPIFPDMRRNEVLDPTIRRARRFIMSSVVGRPFGKIGFGKQTLPENA